MANNGNLPSPKTEANSTRVNFGLLSISGEEALRPELVGFRVSPRVVEHKPIKDTWAQHDEK